MSGLEEFFTSLLVVFASFFDFIKSLFGIDTDTGNGEEEGGDIEG